MDNEKAYELTGRLYENPEDEEARRALEGMGLTMPAEDLIAYDRYARDQDKEKALELRYKVERVLEEGLPGMTTIACDAKELVARVFDEAGIKEPPKPIEIRNTAREHTPPRHFRRGGMVMISY